jgi:spermidine/putrescine transport system ATP-binding protein
MTAVVLEGLERTFDGGTAAVQGVDLEIPAGEFFSLIGPSGCGKTTTLRMLAGLEQPTAGRILVHGADLTRTPAHRRPIHTVFQQYALFPHLNVFDNVAFGLKERKTPGAEIKTQVARMLELVGLPDRMNARPRELSGGMQQRVALARALVLSPQVLLLDEPLGALDLRLRRQMQMLLKSVQREVGVTFLYVTHDQEEAFSMSDRVAVMHEGRLAQVGTPDEVYERPANLFVADFVGTSNRLPGTVVSAGEIKLDNVGPVTAAGVPGLEPGHACVAILRPESVRIDAEGQWAGTVEDRSYLGGQTSLTLRSSTGKLTLIAPSRTVPPDLAVGSHVRAGWDPADLWVVPA